MDRRDFILQNLSDIGYLVRKYDYYLEGKVSISLEEPDFIISSILLHDGRIALGFKKGILIFLNLITHERENVYESESGIEDIKLLSNGRLVIFENDSTIRIFNPEDKSFLIHKSEDKRWITVSLILPDDTIIAGSHNPYNREQIVVWNSSKNILFTLSGHTGSIKSLCILDNFQLVSLSADSAIKVWNLQLREILLTFETDFKIIRKYHDRIIGLTYSDVLMTLDVNTGEYKNIVDLRSINPQGYGVIFFEFIDDMLIVGMLNKYIYLCDLLTGKINHISLNSNIQLIKFLPNNDLILMNIQNEYQVWNLETQTLKITFPLTYSRPDGLYTYNSILNLPNEIVIIHNEFIHFIK